jgi:chlorite dismutase
MHPTDDTKSHAVNPNEAPQTAEGWYQLHELWHVDWSAWRQAPPAERRNLVAQAADWLRIAAAAGGKGDAACYGVVGQKADLMLLFYRESPAALHEAQQSFRRLGLARYCTPAYSYLSVIEASLYEVQAIAHWKLAERKIAPGSPDYATALDEELAKQRKVLEARLFRSIPEARHICFYPMNKRRGEQVNWYALPMDERRKLMKGHGRVGQKYGQQVTQVIGGSIGLDDWEWGVDLHAEDPLIFKKLVTEMRYDPASSMYAEFGPFFIGLRHAPDELARLLNVE